MKHLYGFLLAAFLAAFSLPAFAADYFFEAGTGAGACTAGDPCEDVADANALGLNAGDTLNFNCTDTFNDAVLNLDDNGVNGNPIIVRANGPDCPGADPLLGGAALANCFVIDTDWITIQNIDCTDSTGNGINITGDNSVVDGMDMAAAGAQCVNLDAGDTSTWTNSSVDECQNSGWSFNGTENVTISNSTCSDVGRGGSGDCFAGQNNTYTASTNTLDGNTCNMTSGEQCIDIKSGTWEITGNWTWANCTGQGCGLIHNGNATGSLTDVTFHDMTLDGAAAGDSDWLQCGAGNVNTDNSNCRFERVIVLSGGLTTRWVYGGGMANNAANIFVESSAVVVENGDTIPLMFQMRESMDITITNSTLISRNGDTMNDMIEGNADFVGSVTLKNNVFDLDCTDANCSVYDGPNITLTADYNSWNHDATGNIVEDGATTYTEAGIGSLDGNAQTGDPLFVSEDPASGDFVLPDTGSPAIANGNSAYLADGAGSTTDLVGELFDSSTPNLGARASAASTIAPAGVHHLQQLSQ